MRKHIPEPKRKNHLISLRIDNELMDLINSALLKINSSLEMSQQTFFRIGLKSFANRVLLSDDIGLILLKNK